MIVRTIDGVGDACIDGSAPATSTGNSRRVVVPSPSCPEPFAPQQYVMPLERMPQAYTSPATIWAHVQPGATSVGWLTRSDPRSPMTSPQQKPRSLVSIPHVR